MLLFTRLCRFENVASPTIIKGKCNLYSQPKPTPDYSYLCDPANKNEITNNILCRKGVGNIERVLQLHDELTINSEDIHKDLLIKEMLKIPNRTHPAVLKYGETPRVVGTYGHRSYFFTGQLSELESALVRFYLTKLCRRGFQAISVPDILPRSIIEACGMETQSKRSQVYTLDSESHGEDQCLSGTAEIALAAYLAGKELPSSKLPMRLAAVSRCYRAETSRTSDERGIYRVHQFTKVEMFGVSEPEGSAELLEEFRGFQEEHFASLGLHLQVLDMPPHELGAQAYRKFDVEAWLPGKEMWGEVSSCSDCTDYQSRRLGIRSGGKFVHTVNGTACAIPRLIIALIETHQQVNSKVLIPSPLRPFMAGASVISGNSMPPLLRPINRKSQKS